MLFMNETEIEQKLDYVVHICRENYRLCKALLDCIVNQGVATDKSFKDIEIRIESLQKMKNKKCVKNLVRGEILISFRLI